MSVEKMTAWVPITDEDIIDYLVGSDADIAAAHARIEARQAEALARWVALPWYERLRRKTVYSRRRYEWPRRLSVALDVLRGRHECS